jgi:hypothetical protein
MKLVDVALDNIEVGERRRTDFGDIGALAKGMQLVGLLEPIIVDRNGCDDCYRLVAGERRLRAARMPKWKTIPASLLEHLTEAAPRDRTGGKRKSEVADGAGTNADIRIEQAAGGKRKEGGRDFIRRCGG